MARLDGLLAELAAVVADRRPVADADRIDRLDRLERVRAAVAAAQTAEMVRFAQSQIAQQLAAGVHPKRIGRGIADQIALACRVSPLEGSRRLGVARALWFELPETYGQFTRGGLHERVAEPVVAETGISTPRSGRPSMRRSTPPGSRRWGCGPPRSGPEARLRS